MTETDTMTAFCYCVLHATTTVPVVRQQSSTIDNFERDLKLNGIGLPLAYPYGDVDFTVLELRDNHDKSLIHIQMLHTKTANRMVNYAASRIMLDKFLVEDAPLHLDDAAFEELPKGPVAFVAMDTKRSVFKDLTIDTLRRYWPALFCANAPYVKLFQDARPASIFYWSSLMHGFATETQTQKRIITKYNQEAYDEGGCNKCSVLDRGRSTILGAYFYHFYSQSINLDALNNVGTISFTYATKQL